jgi:hypothetical protein
MPVKKGMTESGDYAVAKGTVDGLQQGETITLTVSNHKTVQKYLYEIGLKQKPRREFSTKKLDENTLRVVRIV